MAKGKIKLMHLVLGVGVGAVAYVAGSKIAEKSATVRQHWYAQPLIVGGVGLLAMKKSPPIGAALAGAAGAMGYLQYSAQTGKVAGAPAQPTAQTTVATQPAPAAQPATYQPSAGDQAAQAAQQAAMQAGTQAAQQAAQALLGGGGAPSGDGTQAPTDTSQPADGTTTAGYDAGALFRARRLQRGGAGAYGDLSQFRTRPGAGHMAPYPGDAGALIRRRIHAAAGLES